MESFPPIYVVSMPHWRERRQGIQRRLDALGHAYEIVDAVDGEMVDWSQHAPRLRRMTCRIFRGRDLVAGEIGCYLSHYGLWERMVAGQTECALILEDDVCWDEDFAETVMQVMVAPWHWEVVAFAYNAPAAVDTVLCPLGNRGRRLVRYMERVSSTMAYLIRLPGARKLCAYCRKITGPVDSLYECWWRNGVAFYRVDPPPVRRLVGRETEQITGRLVMPTPFYSPQALRQRIERWEARKCFIYNKTHPPLRKEQK